MLQLVLAEVVPVEQRYHQPVVEHLVVSVTLAAASERSRESPIYVVMHQGNAEKEHDSHYNQPKLSQQQRQQRPGAVSG